MEAALNGPNGRTTLGPAVLTIGRLPSNSLIVDDAKASSRHAEISPAGSGYSITDVGSTNGTFVNEQRIDRSVPRMLNSGDRIRIGDTVFTYEGAGAFQNPTVYANPEQGNSPGYQPTVAAPYTSYDVGQGYQSPQGYPPPPQQYQPPPVVYPSYVPPVQPAYGMPGYAGTSTAPKMNRNLIIGLGAGGVAVVVILIILFVVILPSTPNKTLDAFCNALKARDYQTAYNQFSSRIQGQLTEQNFATAVDQNPINSCTHGTPNESGTTATASLTLTSPAQQQPATGPVTLIKENGNWKIDNIGSSTP